MSKNAKYLQIFDVLQKKIREGEYPFGSPLPSEKALIRRFNVSRITVIKAMHELVRKGLVFRKRGKGTFVTRDAFTEGGRIGLIVPGLSYGEIFPSICQSIVRFAQNDGFTVLYGDITGSTPARRAREACALARSFVEQRVAGVIFQPLAFLKAKRTVTREILRLFDRADIPVVLIDRDVETGPNSPQYDFVGIDNFAAGRCLGLHLLEQGVSRIHFLMRPDCASVIRDRLYGALSAFGDVHRRDNVIVAEPTDAETIARYFNRRRRPDAIICESDFVAAQLRNTIADLGYSVPEDVMLAGFDDVRCAITATPPLTTIRQPCEDIACFSYKTLRDRMQNRSLPIRKILISAPLIVRASTTRR